MIITMRTTVNIDDRLLEWAKEVAKERAVTLGDLVDEALQRLLMTPHPEEGPELPVFPGGGEVLPGVDLTSNRSMFEALDDPAGGHT
jgi:hypothetical protein